MEDDPIARLLALERLGVKFGLEQIRALTAALDHPQRAYRTVIVAGTNGKGSVTALTDTALRAAGLRSARYTSPHLIRLTERFVVDGREIDTDALRAVTRDVLDVIDRGLADGTFTAPPTFFEATTAIAFEIFRRQHVEIAVLEVGLGGRLDATNIAEPFAGAITSIALDHEEFLGSDVRDIAREKAGVIKPGMDVVLGDAQPEVIAVVEEACRDKGARLIRAFEGVEVQERGSQVVIRTPAATYGPLTLSLLGRHQGQNAVTAIRLLEALTTKGVTVPATAIEQALTHTKWRGRLELVRVATDRAVLFDAAHNPAGARALADYLREAGPALPLVFGAMRDKNVREMLAALLPRVSLVVATQLENPRALAAAEVAKIARDVAPGMPVEVERHAARALARAWRHHPTVVVSGSLFLVGALMESVESVSGPS